MIEETIQQIEARLKAATDLPPATRAELASLVAKLRAEAARLPANAGDENTRTSADADAESMEDTVEQLRRSVEEFEEALAIQWGSNLAPDRVLRMGDCRP